jgi:hypothetical protein
MPAPTVNLSYFITDDGPQKTLENLQEELQAYFDDLYEQIATTPADFDYAGPWYPASGSFPSGAEPNTFYRIAASGTVDDVEFTENDWLIPLFADASTTTYAGNWDVSNFSVVLADAVTTVPVRAREVVAAGSLTSTVTLSETPLSAAYLDVIIDGVVQEPGEWALSGADVSYDGDAPTAAHGWPVGLYNIAFVYWHEA